VQNASRWLRAQIHPASRHTRFVSVQLERCPAMPAVIWAITAGSLGDIQSIITLLCKLGQAVYNAGDASSDYKELKEEMGAFIGTLFQVENALSEVQKVRASISLQSSVGSLASETAQCRADLKNFLNKYAIEDRWNKIKWAFWGNSAATSLRETLMRHRQTIQTQLTMFVALLIRPIHHTKEEF
jgi:hypothetical protein